MSERLPAHNTGGRRRKGPKGSARTIRMEPLSRPGGPVQVRGAKTLRELLCHEIRCL